MFGDVIWDVLFDNLGQHTGVRWGGRWAAMGIYFSCGGEQPCHKGDMLLRGRWKGY